MKAEGNRAIEELRRQFAAAALTVTEDNEGGAHVFIEPIELGKKYRPETTWLGFHIPAQYPYADIYPVFMGADVVRADGVAFSPPVTPGHNFLGRTAIQISRRNGTAQTGSQKATSKILKVLHYLETLS